METRRQAQNPRNRRFFRKLLRVCCLAFLILYVIPSLNLAFSEKEFVREENTGLLPIIKQTTNVQFQVCMGFSELRYICVSLKGTYHHHGNYPGYHSNNEGQSKSIRDILSMMTVLGYVYSLITRMAVLVLNNATFGSHSYATSKLIWLLAIILTKISDFFLIYMAMVGITFLEFFCRTILSPALSTFEDTLVAPLMLFYVVCIGIWKLIGSLNLTVAGHR